MIPIGMHSLGNKRTNSEAWIAKNRAQRLHKISKRFAIFSSDTDYPYPCKLKCYYHNAQLDPMKYKLLHQTNVYEARRLWNINSYRKH